MSDYKYTNVMVTCPYNPTHRMKTSIFQKHISGCRLDYPDVHLEKCLFNATHLLDPSELDYHLLNCPDRGLFDKTLTQSLDQNNPYKGNTSVPTHSDPHVPSEENWDSDTVTPPPISSRPPPPGAIVEPPAMSKPTERKKIYKNMLEMNKQTENDDPTPIRQPVPRQPNPVEMAPKANSTELTDPKTIQNLGLGRGKNRIAAKFNNNTSNGISENSYSNTLENMSNLGRGRGQTVNSDPRPPGMKKPN